MSLLLIFSVYIYTLEKDNREIEIDYCYFDQSC